MFILDSLFLSGFRWVLETVVTAAEAEMNDDTALREQLLAAEMRREMGDIDDEEFAEIEADLLQRIRDIKARREGGSGPIAFGGQPIETSPDSEFSIEATVSGDFHEPLASDHGTVIEGTLVEPSERGRGAHAVPRASRVEKRKSPTRARRGSGGSRARRTTHRTKIR